MKLTRNADSTYHKKSIMAADADGFIDDDDIFDEGADEAVGDSLDNIQDTVEDIQDTVEDIQEDDTSIEVDNNISNHYIAECDKCKGIFISAVIQSDQQVEKISGVCPLCEKDSEQYLKWVVKDINEL